MSNKRITDLTELTNPTTDDVFPVVDIATNTTTKVQLGNLPVPSSVTTALATKQDSLVSGTNIKTINSTSVLGSGNIAVQETLVSGTNIKTINSTSLLGSGNITIAANPSGVSGAIQFSNGSAFASDAANLFWDDTNNRLGIGTNTPTGRTQITESFTTIANNYSAITFDGTITSRATASDTIFGFRNTQSIVATATGQTIIANDFTPNYTFFDSNTDAIGLRIGGLKNTQNNQSAILMQQTATAGNNGLAIQPANSRWAIGYCDAQLNQIARARVVYGRGGIRIGINGNDAGTGLFEIQGSGSTSATTSLLVQNSAGTQMMRMGDAGYFFAGNSSANTYIINDPSDAGYFATQGPIFLQNGGTTSVAIIGQRMSIGKGTSYADASATLELSSTTRGFLPPRMTTTQKNAIASPAAGLVLYDSTTNKLQCYNGSTWNDLF